MWGILFVQLAAASPPAEAISAVHRGVRNGEDIDWESNIVVARGGMLPLADGRTVPVDVGSAVLRETQAGHDGLAPPLVAGDVWQRVELDGFDYTPDRSLGLERRVDSWAPPGLDLPTRLKVDLHDNVHGFAVYIQGDHAVLPGRIVPAGQIGAGTALATGGIFAAAVALLVIGRRLVSRRIIDEEREAYVRQEFLKR